MGSAEQATRRLFFACWPNDDVRDTIVESSSNIIIPNGRRIQPENLHLTLAFVGDVNADKVDDYIQAAENLSANSQTVKPFDICLKGYGHFSRPRVLYMAAKEIPSALEGLVKELNASLSPLGYQPEQRAYTPHVSLFRRANDLIKGDELQEINWDIDRFYLAESIYGPGHAIYKKLHCYKL